MKSLKSVLLILIGIFMLTSISCGDAYGTLIAQDLYSSGDELLTFDNETGLEWIDLTETHGVPYSQIGSLIGIGSALEAFRVATQNEVETLLLHADIPIPEDFYQFESFAFDSGELFINLFGQTGLVGFPSERAAAGTVAVDFGNPGNVLMYEVQAGLLGGNSPFSRIRVEWAGQQSTGGFGIFLVREAAPIPEPATMLLLGSGLIGLAGFRKFKK